MDPVLVKLIDHETRYLFVSLSDHSDAIPLSQASDELVLGPRKLKASILNVENEGQVSADHPANVARLIGVDA